MINNKGFTLIEFLVAIVILMIGLLGMLSGIDLAMRTSVDNTLRNQAVLVADDVMMATRALQFNSISTTVTPVFQMFPQSRRFVGGFYKNYSVRRAVNLTTPQTKEILIDVAWTYKKQRKTHSVSSFVSTTTP